MTQNRPRHGPWEPHRLPLEEMEYTTMPAVAMKLSSRWYPLDEPVLSRPGMSFELEVRASGREFLPSGPP